METKEPKYKCRHCGQIAGESQLVKVKDVWTCSDLGCGGFVDPIPEPQPEEMFLQPA